MGLTDSRFRAGPGYRAPATPTIDHPAAAVNNNLRLIGAPRRDFIPRGDGRFLTPARVGDAGPTGNLANYIRHGSASRYGRAALLFSFQFRARFDLAE